MSDNMRGQTIEIQGANSDRVETYSATPDGSTPRGGVVVIHHMPGYDRETKEAVRRFAQMGYDAICPNLYWREAPGAMPADAAAIARTSGGVPDDRLVGDVAGAVAYLRALPTSNGKVGIVGYCSGGRQSVLAACQLNVDAAVDCYGSFVMSTPPEGFQLKIGNLVEMLPTLSCPLLGLFGSNDQYPSPSEVTELAAILGTNGKDYEFHTYEGAGHAFFSVDRPAAFHSEAAIDGWIRIETFLDRYLAV
jgi:carboxymethylenebutenolidase